MIVEDHKFIAADIDAIKRFAGDASLRQKRLVKGDTMEDVTREDSIIHSIQASIGLHSKDRVVFNNSPAQRKSFQEKRVPAKRPLLRTTNPRPAAAPLLPVLSRPSRRISSIDSLRHNHNRSLDAASNTAKPKSSRADSKAARSRLSSTLYVQHLLDEDNLACLDRLYHTQQKYSM
jgi:hypothetical protein